MAKSAAVAAHAYADAYAVLLEMLADEATPAAVRVQIFDRVDRQAAEEARRAAHARAERERDPIKRLRALGRLAGAGESWVAAQKYHRDAAALEIEREDLRARREAEVLEDVNDEDLVSIIIDGLPKLPRPALARLLLEAAEALSLDLGPAGDTAAAEAEAG